METRRGRGQPRNPHNNETVVRLWPRVLAGELTRADIARQLNLSPQRVSALARQNGLAPLPRVYFGKPQQRGDADAAPPHGTNAAA